MGSNRKIAFMAVSLVAVAAIVSFSFATVIAGRTAKAEAGPAGDGTLLKVSSLNEASEIVGWEVGTIDQSLTDSLESRYDVEVMKLRTFSQGPNSKPVGQRWTLPDGSWIRLVQLPGLDMPNIGQLTKIGTIVSERVFYEADSEMPARVSFYWQDGDMGYCLSGTLTESLTEDALVLMASSVTTQ